MTIQPDPYAALTPQQKTLHDYVVAEAERTGSDIKLILDAELGADVRDVVAVREALSGERHSVEDELRRRYPDPAPAPDPSIRISAAALRDPYQMIVDLRIALAESGIEAWDDNESFFAQRAAAEALLRALGVEAVSE